MKKLIALLLALTCLFGSAVSESPATPTDLVEFDDDNFGSINSELLERKVFLRWVTEPKYYREEATLIAVLMDFLPTDTYTFIWEYSEDSENWIEIEGEHEQTYTFIIDETNYHYYWRVKVIWEEHV